MKKCVIYSRVSTDLQDFESQVNDLSNYATLQKLEVVKSFGEKVSGFDLTKERVEFDNMKDFVFANNIKEVLIWELSRFGRSTAQTLNQIQLFTEHGVNIFFKKENLNTLSNDATNKLLMTMLSAIAELERSSIVERSARGRLNAASKGKATGFTVMPYGYTKDENGYLMLDPEESKIVEMCYKMHSEGKSIRSINIYLNGIGIKTRSAKQGKKKVPRKGKNVDNIDTHWVYCTMNKILRSPLYKGERHYSGQVYKVPTIVSETIWNKVQERFTTNIGYTNRTKYDYLLKSKVICGRCGRHYHAHTEVRPKYKISTYSCNARQDFTVNCKNGMVKVSVLDNSIYDMMLRNTETQLLQVNNENHEIEEAKAQIDFSNTNIQKLEQKRTRIINLYKDGYTDDNTFKRDEKAVKSEIGQIKKEIATIEKKIENLESYKVDEAFKSLANETNFEIKRDFINKYVDKVVVYKVDDYDIDFTKLDFWEIGTKTPHPVKINFKQPYRHEKLVYYELYSFGSDVPKKGVITPITMISYSSEKLQYDNGILTLES